MRKQQGSTEEALSFASAVTVSNLSLIEPGKVDPRWSREPSA